MRYFVIALALVFTSACVDGDVKDAPDVAVRKAECKQLDAHIFQISPQSSPRFGGLSDADAQRLADQMVAKLPPEDIEQCAAAEPEVTSCMMTARDVAAVKACIPPPKVLKCLEKAKQDVAARKACFALPPGDDDQT